MVNHPELRQEIGDHAMLFENDDGRIVLISPLADKVLIGSTDIPFEDPDLADCTLAEEQYFLNMAKKAFPDVQIRPEQIVFRFSGVRPLPVAQVATTGQISRDHTIRTILPGTGLDFPVHCMVGGKWTPFRAFGELMTDVILKTLDRQRHGHLETLPIGGGRDYPATATARQGWLEELRRETGLSLERLEALFGRYGTYGREVATFIAAATDQPLEHCPRLSRREIAFLAVHERVVHIDDLLLRRTAVAMLGELTPALLDELVGIVGEALGWLPALRQAEVDRTTRLLEQRHGIRWTR